MNIARHDEQRARIGEVVLRVIAAEGLEAATVRRISAEAGYSTTIVTHYFADKRELLLASYRSLGDFTDQRFARIEGRGQADLIDYLLSMTACGETPRALWRVYVAIWDKSLRDPDLARVLNSWIETALDRIESFVAGHPDPRRVARGLLAKVQGISVQMLFDPASWSEAEVRAALRGEAAQLLAAA